MDSLAHLGSEQAIATMIDFAAESGRDHVMRSIYEIRDPDAAPLLSASLRSGGAGEFVPTALRKLGSFADPRTLPDLERFLNRSRGSQSHDALRALSKFSDRAAARVLQDFAERTLDERLSKVASSYASRVERRAQEKAGGRERRKG